jgi:hypothetical protein
MKHEYRLSIGDIVLGLELSDYRMLFLKEYFQRASSPVSPHVNLKVVFRQDGLPLRIPHSLYAAKRCSSRFFTIGEELVRGHFDPRRRQWYLRVADSLMNGRLVRVFEQLLYQAFYSACELEDYSAYLIHAAGIAHGGRGFLFVGPAGAGKSTISRLSQTGSVLNDEISLIEFKEQRVALRDTPFNGFYREKVQGCVPLKVVFLLEHGAEHEIEDLSMTSATKALFQQLVPPVGLEESLSGTSIGRMLDVAARLAEAVPVRRLRFRPDPGFWEAIDKLLMEGRI